MTIPLGLRSLSIDLDVNTVLLLLAGLAGFVLLFLGPARSRVIGKPIPKPTAIIVGISLLLIAILQVAKIRVLGDFAAFGLVFELVDKVILVVLIGAAVIQLFVAAFSRKSSTQ